MLLNETHEEWFYDSEVELPPSSENLASGAVSGGHIEFTPEMVVAIEILLHRWSPADVTRMLDGTGVTIFVVESIAGRMRWEQDERVRVDKAKGERAKNAKRRRRKSSRRKSSCPGAMVARMIALRQAGETYATIGAQVGRSACGVRKLLKRLGFSEKENGDVRTNGR